MSYYDLHREERLEYQKQYNKSDYYKAYQQDYFQKNKEKIMKEHKFRQERKKKRKPLPQYKIDLLERMLRRKLKDYNNTIYQQNVSQTLLPPVIFNENEVKPLEGFTIRNGMFVLTF
jgi:hypothetical protein